ncbi:YycH family regulatory protein [Paenibacillus harenae]|uniref:YycH family regulatory protein n=1 Tax=Paenibacillus harenae TaxID=306543 RepID=UPI00040B64ED|nr:two-component system activity regulator YycH [Paenibacillus harenae]
MIEKAKTTVLIVLVALSLLQSYLLAYSMPGLGATVRSDQDYVNAEPMGPAASVESVIFPEELIIHLGDNKHTVIYPGTQFYEMILNQRIQGREFKGFQRSPSNVLNWEEIRRNDIGIELRFNNGIPVELMQKLLKLEGDLLFLNETIDRIWIFKTSDTEEVRTFFFSADGQMVYESVRADLTVRDVQDYVGFGQFQPKYTMTADGLYIPDSPIQTTEIVFPYEVYSPDLMQRSLFFDPNTTRAFEDRSGSQIFTDGKKGLQVEQNGNWISYTDPAAPQSVENLLSDNVYASVSFVNQHGGWDGVHRFVNQAGEGEGKYIRFKQYVEQYPVIETPPFRYGYMRLTVQQGVVTEYARSLITLDPQSESRSIRWLPGGETLLDRLQNYARRGEVTALFPALQALPVDEKMVRFTPVWAVRLTDGTEAALTDAFPFGYEPPEETKEDTAANGASGNTEQETAQSEMTDEVKLLGAVGANKLGIQPPGSGR